MNTVIDLSASRCGLRPCSADPSTRWHDQERGYSHVLVRPFRRQRSTFVSTILPEHSGRSSIRRQEECPKGTRSFSKEAAEAMPAPGKPFWIRNFRAWEANYSIHLGTTGVFVDGLNSFRNDVARWRFIMDRSGFRRLNSREMKVNDIHNPISSGTLAAEGSRSSGGVSSFRDTMPPSTMITKVVRAGNAVQVFGRLQISIPAISSKSASTDSLLDQRAVALPSGRSASSRPPESRWRLPPLRKTPKAIKKPSPTK